MQCVTMSKGRDLHFILPGIIVRALLMMSSTIKQCPINLPWHIRRLYTVDKCILPAERISHLATPGDQAEQSPIGPSERLQMLSYKTRDPDYIPPNVHSLPLCPSTSSLSKELVLSKPHSLCLLDDDDMSTGLLINPLFVGLVVLRVNAAG